MLETLDAPVNAAKKFLVVEDNPNDAFLIKRALQSNGCAAFICRNPGEAQSYLLGAGMYEDRVRYPMPDLILTDLRMGAVSGLILWNGCGAKCRR